MAFVDNLSGLRRADKNHSGVTLAISLQEKIFGGRIFPALIIRFGKEVILLWTT